MAKQTKEIIQDIHEAEERLKSYEMRIRIATTDRDNPTFYEKSRAELVATIATLTERLTEMDYRHAHADEIIADAKANIARLRKYIKVQANQREIAKLLELAAEINKLQG